MMISVKRAYEQPSREDGYRVLVDRLWPRGKSREDLKVDLWAKDIAPSEPLRKWFSHDPERWAEFKSHYFEELEGNREAVGQILREVKRRKITLVYSAKEEKYNNAVALKEFLEKIGEAAKEAA